MNTVKLLCLTGLLLSSAACAHQPNGATVKSADTQSAPSPAPAAISTGAQNTVTAGVLQCWMNDGGISGQIGCSVDQQPLGFVASDNGEDASSTAYGLISFAGIAYENSDPTKPNSLYVYQLKCFTVVVPGFPKRCEGYKGSGELGAPTVVLVGAKAEPIYALLNAAHTASTPAPATVPTENTLDQSTWSCEAGGTLEFAANTAISNEFGMTFNYTYSLSAQTLTMTSSSPGGSSIEVWTLSSDGNTLSLPEVNHGSFTTAAQKCERTSPQ